MHQPAPPATTSVSAKNAQKRGQKLAMALKRNVARRKEAPARKPVRAEKGEAQ